LLSLQPLCNLHSSPPHQVIQFHSPVPVHFLAIFINRRFQPDSCFYTSSSNFFPELQIRLSNWLPDISNWMFNAFSKVKCPNVCPDFTYFITFLPSSPSVSNNSSWLQS
jgi:hypothetical protein